VLWAFAGLETGEGAMTNVAVLVGPLARPAEARELPSGDRLVAYEVTVPRESGRAESVPVVWFDAPASAGTLDVDERVVVVGRVRRRFFRSGAGTQSRTEVVADAVVPARQARRARAALERAQNLVSEASDT
jgi:single-strand DNA-binding protein